MRSGCHAGWIFVLLPACFHPSYDHPACGPNRECPSGLTCNAQLICEAEGTLDSGPPDASARCFGSFFKVCFTTLADVPKVPVILTDAATEIDTDASTLCDQHNDQQSDYCVVAAAGFTLPATRSIRGYGSKPLVLLSTTTMTLEATSTIDVSSNHTVGPQARGAGGNSSLCTSGASPELAGGGYGGSFGGKGGDGERLAGAAAPSGVAAAALISPPTQLRGGCSGGNGDASGGVGGSGGGAVALIAGTSIQLDGKINASGAGGHGGPATQSGGGGGGSGGMIVLDAPIITATGPLFANGGGGGQGGTGGGMPVGGDDGGESSAPLTAGPAGNNGTTDGGSGGAGSFGTSKLTGFNAGGGAVSNGGGGGGGGGGAGFIRARGITTNISPPSFVP